MIFQPLKVKEGQWKVPNVTAGVLRLWHREAWGNDSNPKQKGSGKGSHHCLIRVVEALHHPSRFWNASTCPPPALSYPQSPHVDDNKTTDEKTKPHFSLSLQCPLDPSPSPKRFLLVNQQTGSNRPWERDRVVECWQKVGREPGRWHGPRHSSVWIANLFNNRYLPVTCKMTCCTLQENKKTYILFLPLELVILKTGNTSHTHKCITVSKEMFLVPKELEGTPVQAIVSLTMKSWRWEKGRGS